VTRPDPKKRKSSGRAWITPLAPDAAVARAIALLQQNKDDEAMRLLQSVLARQPNHVDALHFLGVAEHRRGRSEQGLALLDQAIASVPDHPDLHSNRGNLLKALGRLEQAEAAYSRALDLEPLHVNALSNLGTILQEQGQLERAVELLSCAVELEPNHFEAQRSLGIALRRTKRWDAAIVAFENALRLRPGDGDTCLKLGTSYYAVGQVEKASAVYRRWIEHDPLHPMPRHLLAGCTGEAVPTRASDEFVRSSFESFAEHFDQSLQRLEYKAPQLIGEAITEHASAGAGLRVLDAGCGTGLCGPQLRAYARLLVGVDLSPAMLEQARQRALYDELFTAELTAYLERSPSEFDLIACADTLCYFGELERVARAFANALDTGGLLVFSVERSAAEDAPDGFRIHPHGRYSHTEDYLRRVLSDAGFHLLAISAVELRREAGLWVLGWVVSARRETHSVLATS
jgi:predicted TPR repeat methyltransferase